MILVNKVLKKLKFSKNVNNKKCVPKLIFFNEKKIEKDSDNFWRGKLTLKVRNRQFLIIWFRAVVDLPEFFSYERVLFFTQLSYHLMWKLLKKSYMLSIEHILNRSHRFWKIPSYKFIDFLDFFHPPLLFYLSYVLFSFFPKKISPSTLIPTSMFSDLATFAPPPRLFHYFFFNFFSHPRV